MVQNSITFDYVHDCQETFRLMLHAISNPGEIVNIKNHSDKLKDDFSHMLLLAVTLLDKETSYCVLDNEELDKLIAQLTYAYYKDENADYIFVSEKYSYEKMIDILIKSSPGTLVNPHANTTLIICDDMLGNPISLCLEGPGIKDSKTIEVSDYIKQWISTRDLMEYEYPLGVDLFFITKEGELLSIPRKVKMKG
ncbi:phosphonate C-P lyase system protein PhnH [Sedimentibacter sp. MB31-C6]|uniref:phosphonate C-P lyase system protein PhnH n=1 Tax=Sedimentibacter sp. MB31-C6 TaxID=3109366 RepID=UPI002DDD9BC3|nr:phosphonate C-P lyase system protein PhnH [Sedimentibacter sp. MB36-C1]WSI03621.1 phosphonate C-P lyase system protein PhnH [Sedimentibacter sp. MB36-C1]